MANNIGLIILDGWGIGDKSKSDAIYNSKTPFMDHLLSTYPNARLGTSGEDVGLPDGQMGNRKNYQGRKRKMKKDSESWKRN